jgi:glycosyltransferase involved in cell wall biosynthesis
VGGLQEIVIDGVQGWICRDDPQFVGRCEELLKDEPARRQMGKAGREHVAREYPLDRFLRQIEAVYEEVLGPRA